MEDVKVNYHSGVTPQLHAAKERYCEGSEAIFQSF